MEACNHASPKVSYPFCPQIDPLRDVAGYVRELISHSTLPAYASFSNQHFKNLPDQATAATMAAKQFLLALLISNSIAFPLDSPTNDPQVAQIIATAKIPKYIAPDLNRDITDWLAIGDSFSAGISADVPADMIEYSCSRFKQSYPNQMNENPRFPGHSTSRTFVFGSCSGGKMQDLIDHQIELGQPDLSATYPKIGVPQIGTVSISG